MKILLVNVNTSTAATAAMVTAGRGAVGPGVEVVGLTPGFGSAGVDSNTQSLLAAVAVMAAVCAFPAPFDAVVLAGFGEHGREALQELLTVPVIDIAEAAVHAAMMLGRRFSVVTTLPRSVAQIEDRLLLAGLGGHCASIRSVGLSTRQLDDNAEETEAAVAAVARTAVDVDGAEVIVLGCGGLAGLAQAVSVQTGVPVVEGVATGVVLAEALVRLGLRTSSRGSCAPPELSATTPWPPHLTPPVGSAID